MECPVDHHEIRWIAGKDSALSQCDRCVGLWISRRGVERIFAARGHEVPLRINLALRRAANFKPGLRQCPGQCVEQMLVATVNQIDVDVCPKCGGVWFDEGELPSLLKWYRSRNPSKVIKQPPAAARADGHPVVDLAIDGADAVFSIGAHAIGDADFLGEAVEAIGDLLSGIFS